MRFTAKQIELAQLMQRRDLPWLPSVGQFVWDEAGWIEKPSPFHDRVYFILDLKHFLRRCETMAQLSKVMTWLPTWHDAIELLQSQGVEREAIAERLHSAHAIESGKELETLYEMILETLPALA